jgi:uncharacterized protein (TIGR02646 family)
MRFIQKPLHLDGIPDSLRFPSPNNFEGRDVPEVAKTTHEKRSAVILQGKYNSDFDDRYKKPDVKAALDNIYHRKCAYCEQEIEQMQVEHYRPKHIYYWLAFSWDNLLCVCPFCNVYKSTNFEIMNLKAAVSASDLTNSNINDLGSLYDQLELPKLVNPEVTNPDGMLAFEKDGTIHSDDPRFQYTIDTCRVSRTYLKDKRKTILDDFRKHIRDAYLENTDAHDRSVAVKTVLNQLKASLSDEEKPFLAFRHYLAQNWVKEEIKAIALP